MKAQLLPRRLRRWLLRRALRGTPFADRHERFDIAYRLTDPWSMNRPREQARFRRTNEIIEREFGHVGRLLELGCGEGHQSLYLAELCDSLHGIDPSERAVERARRLLPQSRFDAGDLFAQPWVGERDRFDLIVGCEMLYYVADMGQMIEALERLAPACLVTFLDRADELHEALADRPGAGNELIEAEGTRWRAVWWRRAAAAG